MKHALMDLKPNWVEFTSTKGALRILQQNEARKERHRASGMIFECPKCALRSKNGRAHNCIFLFDESFGTPMQARPHPRFLPKLWRKPGAEKLEPVNFDHMTLYQIPECPHKELTEEHQVLHPGDLKCKWEGTVIEGMVEWTPSLIENIRRS